jgi:hypothetical protein
MFYRVLNESGAVVVAGTPSKTPGGNVDPLTEGSALSEASRLAQAQPGRKFYVAKAVAEVVVNLPAAVVTDLK